MTRALVLGCLLFLAPATAWAQVSLTLDEAIARARTAHLEVRAAGRRVAAGDARSREARAAWYPRVDASEAWQRGDLPVFAFGALLSQRRFSAADFDVSRLNHPDRLDNFRSAVSVEQRVFDPGVSAAVRTADLGRRLDELNRDDLAQRVVIDTIETFGRIQLFDALTRASAAAVEAAEADLTRARDRRDAGLATDGDVWTVEVHRLAARERQVQTASDAAILRGRFNYLVGAPLDAPVVLTPLAPAASVAASAEADAVARRPDVQSARVAVELARAQVTAARAAFAPQAVARGGLEWNGGAFDRRAGSWFVGAEVRIALFRGMGDRAHLAAMTALAEAQDLERAAIETRARLDLRAAEARRGTADVRVDLARAAVTAATESQRITRDRYEQGLADVSALVARAQAVLDAEAQLVTAEVDRVILTARLRAARGVL